MKKIVLFSFLVAVCVSNGLSQTFLPFGSQWAYYDLGNKPPKILGKNWQTNNYNDTTWMEGPAQLGYGEGDEATVIAAGVLAAYFRRDSILINTSSSPSYDINLLFDDGAVVYLNGNEVGRVNMAAGSPGYYTLASSSSSENEITTFNVPATAFVNGYNVIAVEVHQKSVTSSDLSFDLELIAPPPIKRGPYLQNLTSSSFVVKWRTAYPTESIVRYGLSPATILNAVSDLTLKTEHEIEITGLSPAAKYYYQIEDNSGIIAGPEEEMYVKIAPPVGSTSPIKAWILGDPGTANGNQRSVRDAYYDYIGTDHTDIMLFLGDNAYNSGTDEEYQYAMFEDMYEDKMKNTVAWSCLGNHDGYTADSPSQSGPYYDIFTFPKDGEAGGTASGTEAYYSFDYGNIHFIILDSYETNRAVGAPMYNWVLSDIQSTTQEWIVAIWHHPAYTKGSHNSDNPFDSSGSMEDMREIFLPILEDNGVDLVMSGHSHSYERSYFVNGHYGNSTTFSHAVHTIPINGNKDGQETGDGVYEKDICVPGSVYITTGSAGKTGGGSLNHPVMFYSAAALGSVVMEVEGPEMNVKFVRNNGNVDDFFTIEKGSFGAACDDGDPCTYNDVFDAVCNCAGVLQPIDTDMDGTDDCLDGCPNDPLKIEPGICGCSVSDTLDTDGDSTIDCLDGCPNDPNKTNQGMCGCGISDMDSDGDGTADCNDLCPTDGNKTTPGICGCGVLDVDSDNDQTYDCDDLCPNDAGKIAPGICGCGVSDVDTDGDTVADCNDLCPNDVGKIAPGICGCGVTDIDTDGDMVVDCNDECPNDPLKTALGVCGCGVEDIDTDSDGTPDCTDLCPNDPLKTEPGSCGCGSSNSNDTDNDGTPDCADECPNDPNKTSPGICGCLKADVDADGDGVCDLACLPNLFVNLFANQNSIYSVSERITSNAVLDAPLYMEFSAGTEIQLNPGFEITYGASLHAYILGCSN